MSGYVPDALFPSDTGAFPWIWPTKRPRWAKSERRDSKSPTARAQPALGMAGLAPGGGLTHVG
jgi:hypothetical protein